MKKFLIALTALLFASVASAQGVNIQGLQVQPFNAKHAGDVLTAVSTDVGIYVKYVGTNAAAATVAVDAATGDLTFLDSGAATDDFECPVSGALGGVIDVSNAACNTVGEVLDIINASDDWVAVAAGMLRTDSSDNTLITLAATTAKTPEGLGLLKDTAVALNMTAVVLPGSNGGRLIGIQNWLPNFISGGSVGSARAKLAEKPFADTSTTLLYGSALMTTTDNAANLINVYCVREVYTNGGTGSSSTTQTLYSELAGLTTVIGKFDELVNAGGVTCDGGKLLFRVNGNTTLTVPTVVATGFIRPTKF